MHNAELTAAQQDYLEAIYRLAFRRPGAGELRPLAPVVLEMACTPRSLEVLPPFCQPAERELCGVRVTDIAAELGTKLPTVVRSVARLKELGLLRQRQRGLVHLSPEGSRLAAQLAHRHADVVAFLADILGVAEAQAESEACLIEHGLSGDTAQRLHEFLERWKALPAEARAGLAAAGKAELPSEFGLVGGASGAGGRK
jgi:DtxR family Mn-dependent transcriptional regulator